MDTDTTRYWGIEARMASISTGNIVSDTRGRMWSETYTDIKTSHWAVNSALASLIQVRPAVRHFWTPRTLQLTFHSN